MGDKIDPTGIAAILSCKATMCLGQGLHERMIAAFLNIQFPFDKQGFWDPSHLASYRIGLSDQRLTKPP